MPAGTRSRTRARVRFTLTAASLLGLLLLLVAPAASADVIHLRTGEAVKGRAVQERSNDAYLTVEDYLSGVLRRFAWEALDPQDRDRLQEKWGWINSADQGVIEGVRIVIRLSGGDQDEVLGLLEGQDARVYRVRRNGKIQEVAKSMVVTVEEEPLDIRRVYTPEQLYERSRKQILEEGGDLDDLGSREHWRLASEAEWAGNLERAAEHYEAAGGDEEFLKRDVALQRLKRVNSLLQDQAALGTLKDAGLKQQMHLFRRVRDILDKFPEKHPEASEEVLKRVEQFRAELQEERTQYFQLLARRGFPKLVEDLIEDKVREKDVQITDVTAWTRRELPDAAFARLAEKLARFDDVTPEEARAFWDGRRKGHWKRVSYGGGTFIVDPPKIKPPKKRRRPAGGKRRGGGASSQMQIPKPPTRDQWWNRANPKARATWTMAYFAERSELFELGEREARPCSMCHAVGLLSKTLQTGDVLTYLCVRCGGAQNDVVVKYR